MDEQTDKIPHQEVIAELQATAEKLKELPRCWRRGIAQMKIQEAVFWLQADMEVCNCGDDPDEDNPLAGSFVIATENLKPEDIV